MLYNKSVFISYHKKRLIVFFFIALFAMYVFPRPASAAFIGINFGGRITFMNPACVAPPGIFLTVGPPRPGSFMYLWGVSRSYLQGPPTHPSQWLLGKAAPAPALCLIPCPIGLCPAGAGPIILFHGSSLN